MLRNSLPSAQVWFQNYILAKIFGFGFCIFPWRLGISHGVYSPHLPSKTKMRSFFVVHSESVSTKIWGLSHMAFLVISLSYVCLHLASKFHKNITSGCSYQFMIQAASPSDKQILRALSF